MLLTDVAETFDNLRKINMKLNPKKCSFRVEEGKILSQPDGFVDPDNPNHVYKLKKALYGLKQAPRAWYNMLSSFLISQEFFKGSVDPTLFIRKNGNDLLLMSMMKKISFFLGLQISQNPRGIFINQFKYALESLKKYGFESWEPEDTPMVEKSKLDEDKEGKAHIDIRYHFIKEQVENGVIELYFVNTEYQLADLFTKALGRDRTEFLTNKLGMRSFTPETLKKLMNDEDETIATTLDQQVALDEALVPSTQRLRIGRSNFRLPSDIQSKEPTLQVATAKLHQHSIRFKMDTRKHVLDLEAFRELLHISPRIPGQSFAELPFEQEILEFLRKPSIPRRNRVNWHYVRDDILFSTIKVVSRHQTTQQYAPKPKASARKKKGGFASSTTPPTPIATPTLTTTVVAAPRLSAAAKGKQPARATTPTEPTDVERTEAKQLKIVLKRSRQETHISQQRGSGTDEGTGSRPGVPDVPSDVSEEKLSWNSSDDEDVDEQTKGREEGEGDKTDESNNDDDDQDEAEKSDEGDNEATESDRESEDEETREQEEESFDPIPQTPKDNEDDDNNEEDQGLRIGEEEMMQEEEDAEELYHDFKMLMMGKISFFLGLQISQNPRGIFVNQSKYALESLKKYSFESCDPVDTLMVEKSKLDEDREGKAVDPLHYHEYKLADLFTKALGQDRIEFLTTKLGMRSFTLEMLKQLMNEEDE
nr:hypothetical protein [Tanacetum cinerariifolium]